MTITCAVPPESPFGDGERLQPNAYGEVVYTHAGGIDRPLAVYRAGLSLSFFPHANWRSLYDGATNTAGELIPCKNGSWVPCSNSPDIDWPGSVTSAFIGSTSEGRTTPAEWAGSLVVEQADASGLLYRRNRYYDPGSGRFTQPDPIGLAGGLNAYGFANGDPVSYSDPFGLCPYAQEKRDDNVDDCPEDEVGDALRWLKENGGKQGQRTIETIRDKELNPMIIGQDLMEERFPGAAGLFNDKNPQLLVILGGRSVTETAFTVTHEVGHASGGLFGGWRAHTALWKEVDPALRPNDPRVHRLISLESRPTLWEIAVRRLERRP